MPSGRTALLTAFAAVLSAVSALAQTSLADDAASPVQAVIVYRVVEQTPNSPPTETWFKHGGDIRADWLPDSMPGEVSQVFLNPDRKTTLKLIRAADGRWRYAHFSTEAGLGPAPIRDRVFTGETQTHLGETCRVWQQMEQPPSQGVSSAGCVTGKGIELWWTSRTRRRLVATSIAYQPVPAGSVALPWRVLDLDNWAASAKPADHRSDYKVCLRTTAADDIGTCRTRSGAWTWSTSGAGTPARFYAKNSDSGLTVDFETSPGGSPSLLIRRTFEAVVPYGGSPVTGRPNSLILGHDCAWVDMETPGEVGALDVCKTRDGIILAIESSVFRKSPVRRREYAARFDRAPQPLPDALSSKQWDTAFRGD